MPTSSPYKRMLQEEKERAKAHTKKSKAPSKEQKPKRNRKPKVRDHILSSDEDEDPDTLCLYCNDSFTRSVSEEGWVRCSVCKKWAHDMCAGIGEEDECFACELCV